MTEQQSTKHS